jgi:hypothetical protein
MWIRIRDPQHWMGEFDHNPDNFGQTVRDGARPGDCGGADPPGGVRLDPTHGQARPSHRPSLQRPPSCPSGEQTQVSIAHRGKKRPVLGLTVQEIYQSHQKVHLGLSVLADFGIGFFLKISLDFCSSCQ